MSPKSTGVLDPEEFPFTEAELCVALAQVLDMAEATHESARHAAGIRWEVEERASFAARLAAPPTATSAAAIGSSFGSGIYMWYPAEALALLTLLDPALAERVHAHRHARRLADRGPRVRRAVWRATGAVDVPVPAAVAVALDAEDAAAERAWDAVVTKMRRRIAAARRAGRDVRT
jgi:hypothetical protein